MVVYCRVKECSNKSGHGIKFHMYPGNEPQLNDSSMIVSALSSYVMDNSQSLGDVINFYPFISFIDEEGTVPKDRTVEDITEERKWRVWADKKLVHSLSPNVYRTPKEALQAFTWFSDVGQWDTLFPFWERALIVYVGAAAMWLIGKELKSRHNLKDDVRASLYDDCNHWMKALNTKGTSFMGGNEPNLAELAAYGILNSIEGCDAFQDILKNTKLGTWYNKMKKLVTKNAGSLT